MNQPQGRVATSVDLLFSAFIVLLCGANFIAEEIQSQLPPPEGDHRYALKRLKKIFLSRDLIDPIASALGVSAEYVISCACGSADDVRVRSCIRAVQMATRVRGNGHLSNEERYIRAGRILDVYSRSGVSL